MVGENLFILLVAQTLPSNKGMVADVKYLPLGEGVSLPTNKGEEADIIDLPSGEGVTLPTNKGKEADKIDLPSGEGMGADSFVVSTTTVLGSFDVGAGTFELPSGKELGADTFNVATTLLPRDLGATSGGGSSCWVAIEAIGLSLKDATVAMHRHIARTPV